MQADATAARPVAHRAARVRVSVPTLMLVWLVSYFALSVLTGWLWEARGAASAELLFWQAKRRLIFDVTPPNLMVLLLADPLLVFYAMLLSGSAFHAAALLGATGITGIAFLLRRIGAPGVWLLLLVLHPATLLSATQYPSVFLRATLLALTLLFLLEYLRAPAAHRLFFAALTLGALALVDLRMWPLWLYIGSALVWIRRRAVAEHLTLLLVAFFPALFISIAGRYLGWMQSDSFFYHRLMAHAALDSLRYWLPGDPALAPYMAFVDGGLGARLAAALAALAWYVPAQVVLIPFALLRLSHRLRRWYPLPLRWQGFALAVTVPLCDVLWRFGNGQARAPVLEMTAPLLAVALLHRELRLGPGVRRLTTLLLLAGLLTGWLLVAHEPTSEPQQLVQQALTQKSALPSVPFQAVAAALNQRLLPGQRVLLDDVTLFPLVGTVDDARALILSHQFAYDLAIQNPASYADYVVIAAPESPLGRAGLPTRAPAWPPAGYELVLQSGDLQLYGRPDSRQPQP